MFFSTKLCYNQSNCGGPSDKLDTWYSVGKQKLMNELDIVQMLDRLRQVVILSKQLKFDEYEVLMDKERVIDVDSDSSHDDL